MLPTRARYDVSKSFQREKGTHQVIHRADCDLTEALKETPHFPDRLFRLPIVGKMAEEES